MSTHSRLASDRYLHFPPNFHRANEYLSFAVNISSDNEDEEQEYEKELDDVEISLKEWVIVKAEEANIRLSNNFVPQISSLSQQRKSIRVSCDRESVDSGRTNSQHSAEAPIDIFSVVNRTFELTSFDALLKEARACKVITLDGLNQSLFQTTSFMKMFKSPESSKNNNEEDDDDDEDDIDEPLVTATEVPQGDEHIQVDEDRNNNANKSLTEPYKLIGLSAQGIGKNIACTGAKNIELLGLQSGLKSSSQVYSFEYQEPSEQDMAKYRRYACMAQPNVDASTAAIYF
uniref:Uncharacterized protein n=1 Tax=Ditylenchus dipsaci TaxID=166011 RepID=A0A915EQQ7_9BILA